jgi:hypothetical protein
VAAQSAVDIASDDPIERGEHVGNVRCRGDAELGAERVHLAPSRDQAGVLRAHGNHGHAGVGVPGHAAGGEHLGEETEHVVATAARDSAPTSLIQEATFFLRHIVKRPECWREAYNLGVGVGHRNGDIEGGDVRGPDGERAEWRRRRP